VTKVLSGERPNVVDVIQDGTVQCVINTPEGRITHSLRDGFHIRRAAAEKRIPCFTSIDTARVAVEAMSREAPYEVATLKEYAQL
jgi:carbamoyl-phosphate synthase large subunit